MNKQRVIKNSLLLWVCCYLTTVVPTPATPPPPKALQPADVPVPKTMADGSLEPHFLQTHQEFVDQTRAANFDLVFLGDSITRGWLDAGKDVWTKSYASYHPANFGIGGNKTQNLLWEVENGELDGAKPRVVVVMIGTNNANYPAEEIYRAEARIVEKIRAKLPDAKVLLLGILPREYDRTDPYRTTIKKVNARLARLDDGKSVRFLDMADKFQSPDGKLLVNAYSDFLHLTPTGYQIWADTMQPLLEEMASQKGK